MSTCLGTVRSFVGLILPSFSVFKDTFQQWITDSMTRPTKYLRQPITKLSNFIIVWSDQIRSTKGKSLPQRTEIHAQEGCDRNHDHSTCMHCDHSKCVYYDHSTCMYYMYRGASLAEAKGYAGPTGGRHQASKGLGALISGRHQGMQGVRAPSGFPIQAGATEGTQQGLDNLVWELLGYDICLVARLFLPSSCPIVSDWPVEHDLRTMEHGTCSLEHTNVLRPLDHVPWLAVTHHVRFFHTPPC